MTLGFQQAGFNVACGVDASERAIRSHAKNFPRAKSICADVRRLTGPQIMSIAGLPNRSIDVLFGGPPCQGFSIGGAMDPRDERNDLILQFARLVVGLRPSYFVLENVVGLLNSRYAPLIAEFERIVRTGGFSLTKPVRVLDAVAYGVPQRRRRVFFLGNRKGQLPLAYPKPMPREMRPTVWDAIGDLYEAHHTCRAHGHNEFSGQLGPASAYASILRGETDDPGICWPRKRRVARQLGGFAATEHSEGTIQRFSRVEPGKRDPISRFIRLRKDGTCTTLRAGTDVDRGRFMAPRPIHPVDARCICVREAARLHSFPDWFAFDDTRWHGFMQVGNSVPPHLARAVAAEVVRAIKTSPSR